MDEILMAIFWRITFLILRMAWAIFVPLAMMMGEVLASVIAWAAPIVWRRIRTPRGLIVTVASLLWLFTDHGLAADIEVVVTAGGLIAFDRFRAHLLH